MKDKTIIPIIIIVFALAFFAFGYLVGVDSSKSFVQSEVSKW